MNIDELSTSATTTDRIEAATLRLKSIGAMLRQLGSTPWTGIDREMPEALAVIGSDLHPIVDLLNDVCPLVGKPEAGPIEGLHRDYQGRALLYDLTPETAPGDTEADRVAWLSEPADKAQMTCPETARDWAAKILLMTLDGSMLEREGHLQALVDDARATLGIRAGEAS
jgi:hypothetical protein